MDSGIDDPAISDDSPDVEGSSVDATDEGTDGALVGCLPASVSGFQPPPFHSIQPSMACSGFFGDSGLVQAYGDDCIGHSSSYEACSALRVPDAAGAADCYSCLVTVADVDSGQYGAVVKLTRPVVDYAGCVESLDPTDAGAACANTIAAAASCVDYACARQCPITDQASSDAFIVCSNVATSGACDGYWLRARACIAQEIGDAGTAVASICFAGATTEDDYLSIAHYFCGAD
jgi:hypothetical protein